MPEIKVSNLVSFSSEDSRNQAHNILKHESIYKWRCSAHDRQANVVLKFKEPSVIHSIDIGNNGSAFVEVLVGRKSWSSDKEMQVLLASSTFMSPSESKSNKMPNRVRILEKESLNSTVAQERWDCVKIVCTQPFQKTEGYGLAFIKFHSPPDSNESSTHSPILKLTPKIGVFDLDDDVPSQTLSAGSFFKNRFKVASPVIPKQIAPTMAALAREASRKSESTQNDDKLMEVPKSNEEFKAKKRQLPSYFYDKTSPAKASAVPTDVKETKKQPTVIKTHAESSERKDKPSGNIRSTENLLQGNPKKRINLESDKHESEIKKPTSRADPGRASTSRGNPVLETVQPTASRVQLNKILANVVFVMSGFVNPERSDLRDKAVAMGAKYEGNWSSKCTHLICAFKNTPKAKQVKDSGKGRIVSKKWINNCYSSKRRLPTSKYRLDDDSSSSEGEEDPPKYPIKKQTSKKSEEEPSIAFEENSFGEESSSDCDTEDELNKIRGLSNPNKSDKENEKDKVEQDEMEPLTQSSSPQLPELPDYFNDQHFLLYGTFSDIERKKLGRLITAYNGFTDDYMGDNTDIIISKDQWDNTFKQASNDNPKLKFLHPEWIYECHKQGETIAMESYIIRET